MRGAHRPFFRIPPEAFPKAEAAARRAAPLDSSLAAPRATLGYVQLYHRWDLARGEEEFRRAIALDPNYSTAHQWYANQCRQTIELNADYGLAHLWRGWALQELDSLPAAVAAHRRALAVSDSAGLYVASLARSLALVGERDEAEALLRRLEARGDSGRYVPSYEVAKVHDALGRPDRALAWLERALGERSHSMVFLRVDPQLARLRRDPRFARLEERVLPR